MWRFRYWITEIRRDTVFWVVNTLVLCMLCLFKAILFPVILADKIRERRKKMIPPLPSNVRRIEDARLLREMKKYRSASL